MSIEIRTRVLKNGSQSLYLDCYENGKREYESLHLYLVPEVNEEAKRENKNAMKKAVAIKAERLLGIRMASMPQMRSYKVSRSKTVSAFVTRNSSNSYSLFFKLTSCSRTNTR